MPCWSLGSVSRLSHAGGVGLCELVQHQSAFDDVRASGEVEGPDGRAEEEEWMDRAFREMSRLACRNREPAAAAALTAIATLTGVNDFPNIHARRSSCHASSR